MAYVKWNPFKIDNKNKVFKLKNTNPRMNNTFLIPKTCLNVGAPAIVKIKNKKVIDLIKTSVSGCQIVKKNNMLVMCIHDDTSQRTMVHLTDLPSYENALNQLDYIEENLEILLNLPSSTTAVYNVEDDNICVIEINTNSPLNDPSQGSSGKFDLSQKVLVSGYNLLEDKPNLPLELYQPDLVETLTLSDFIILISIMALVGYTLISIFSSRRRVWVSYFNSILNSDVP